MPVPLPLEVLSAPFSQEIVPPDPSSVTDGVVPVTMKLPLAPVVSTEMPAPADPETAPLLTVTLLNVTFDAPMFISLIFTPVPAVPPEFVVVMVLLVPVTTSVPTSDAFDALNAVPLVVVIDMEVA